jgi:hypothetical protein
MRRRRSESASRREFEFSDRDWASRSLPLALPRGSCGTFAWLTSAAPASPACCGPPCLSAVGKPDDPGSLPENLLPAEGIRHQVTQRTLVSISKSHDWPARREFVRLALAASGEPPYTTMSATGRVRERRSDTPQAIRPTRAMSLALTRTIAPSAVVGIASRSSEVRP